MTYRFLPQTLDLMTTVFTERQNEMQQRMGQLVERLRVVGPLLQDHRVHLAAWSVAATRLD